METQAQSVETTAQKIFTAIDQHGPAMQQRIIREALDDLYIVANTNGFHDGLADRG